MKKVLIVLTALMFVLPVTPAAADEGMWLLPYLNKLNIKDMRAKGLKLKAEDIYSVNKGSLKDAIVIFGGGCTGEVVSAEGLLLTNHHCGYGQIQALSSVENDYLKNGFWAMSRGEEIPAPGLAVTFIRRMDDMTDLVLAGTEPFGPGPQRDSIIAVNIMKVTEGLEKTFPDWDIEVRDFMGGNQFFMIASERYTDVRLVGTPPNSMGKFGGDTDNWMWPRHTDDFSMFRIYAGPDNKPAAYSPDNKPYQAPVHLKISLKGIKENDFAMIMGFPGSTDRYMTTFEMKRLMEQENTARIYVRGERQAIIMEDMLANDEVRLKYAAKYAQSSNYWKNSIGKNKALVDNKIPERQAALESRFQTWANTTNSPEQYQLALPKMKEAVEASSESLGVYMFLVEALWSGIELSTLPQRVSAVMNVQDDKVANKDEIMAAVANFYKNYNEPTDRRVAKRMLAIVRERIPAEKLPTLYAEIDSLYDGNIDAYVDNIYDNSVYVSQERLLGAIDNYNAAVFQNDPVTQLSGSVRSALMGMGVKLSPLMSESADWHRVYVKGLTLMNPATKFYPDANFSIRLTYGQVLPYDPRDGVTYKYYTTLAGVLEKEDATKPLEFTVEEGLKTAYATADYGRYGQNGELRVNFLTNNDITGGNSGSPVLNARGELIGLAFDGNWEAMSSDIMFEPRLQRCINVDIRYVLWTIDKFAGAGHLLREMTIVQ
ncbi:MAG: S46 family peptidase [Alistipes sp.]|jgi:hypothetical protein|nr:S46 family peptidase [Alistipes sp.]